MTNEALTFKYSYEIPSYKEYKENIYNPEGWIGRKITAIPKVIISGTLFAIYRVAKGVLLDLPRVFFGNVKPLKDTIFRSTRDIQSHFGNITTIFNDRLGGYIRFSAINHVALYNLASSPKLIMKLLDEVLTEIKGKSYLPKMIIKNLDDVNALKSDHYPEDTLLMLVVRRGFDDKKDKEELVKMLLSKGADMTAENKKGETALAIAIDNGYEEIANLLTKKGALGKGCDVDKKIGWEKDTLLMLAARKGCDEQVKKLLEKGANITEKNLYGETALSFALQNGHEKTAELLIENGTIDDGVDLDSLIGGYLKKTLLILAAEKGCKNVVSNLIEKGATVTKNVDGLTALFASVREGHEEVAQILIKNGALENIKNINEKYASVKRTLLMAASHEGCHKVVTDLINRGAKVTKKNESDETALSLAMKSSHEKVAELLIDNGAVDKETDLNREYKSIRLHDGSTTLLRFAITKGLKQVASKLLDRGAKISKKCLEDNNFLMRAAEKGFKQVVEQWVNQGGDVKVKGWNGSNALHYAAQNGHLELVKFLIEQGVPVTSKGVYGKTALDFAKDEIGGKKEDKKKVVEYLSTL